MAIIYKIINNKNNKIYIGKTIKKVEERFKEHLNEARKWAEHEEHTFNSKLYPAMNKYGIDEFKIEIIEECEDEVVNEREKYWIDKLDTTNDFIGYNISPGGLGGPLFKGHKHSTETLKKLSSNNYWKTHKQSKEYIDKRFKKLRSNLKRIQCLDTGEIYLNHIELDRKFNGSSEYAIKHHRRFRGLFYIELDEKHQDGYDFEDRKYLVNKYKQEIHDNISSGVLQALERTTEEQKNVTNEKRKETIKNKSLEEKEVISQHISNASKRMWANMSDEKYKEFCNQHRNSALQQYQKYSEEDRLRIYEKISLSQKGKGFYKNIETGEIKLITPKNFCYYDFENIWKKCHKDGTLWED